METRIPRRAAKLPLETFIRKNAVVFLFLFLFLLLLYLQIVCCIVPGFRVVVLVVVAYPEFFCA